VWVRIPLPETLAARPAHMANTRRWIKEQRVRMGKGGRKKVFGLLDEFK
jgi:hypothetical protein